MKFLFQRDDWFLVSFRWRPSSINFSTPGIKITPQAVKGYRVSILIIIININDQWHKNDIKHIIQYKEKLPELVGQDNWRFKANFMSGGLLKN